MGNPMIGSGLLVNLVLALALATVGAALAARLGQSVILGYILCGVVLSPTTPGPVGATAPVEALADIGVILLMFTVGMRLSLRELRAVGRVAVLGGGAQILLLIGVGYLIARGVGWGWQEAIFFGAVVSNSSSTVLSKVLGDRGQAGALHTRIALGWSTVQDLSTVVLIVVLTALVVGGSSSSLAGTLGMAAVKAGLFLFLLLGVGSRVLPWLFERVAALRNREIFVLAVAAFALGVAYASVFFGLSLALGAFVAGVVVSESDLSHEILGSVQPLRDVFVGLFFVSVGMLVDVGFLVQQWPYTLLVVAVIVLIKGACSTGIARLFGYRLETALLTGVALAQSAEFSFLLARAGADVGALSPAVFSYLLGGSVASIALAPWLNAWAEPAARAIERRQTGRLTSDAVPDLKDPAFRGHAVICGYGRVGRLIGAALRRRDFSFIVIEQDRDIVRALREQGIYALLGSADNLVLLEQTHLTEARILVVAIPDALGARVIVDYARRVNPHLDIVVRVHSEDERRFMLSHGAGLAVLPLQEAAFEMTRHTLRRFGVSAIETLAIIQRMRGDPAEHDPTGPDVLPH